MQSHGRNTSPYTNQHYPGSSSWIRRGGPLFAVVEQFEFFINVYTYF
ncbi:hypothetical protein M2101_001929 [Parabacteroides sp. PM5-20]|nr:hypothetical protein [Parabacteroides sp. PM5-20]